MPTSIRIQLARNLKVFGSNPRKRLILFVLRYHEPAVACRIVPDKLQFGKGYFLCRVFAFRAHRNLFRYICKPIAHKRDRLFAFGKPYFVAIAGYGPRYARKSHLISFRVQSFRIAERTRDFIRLLELYRNGSRRLRHKLIRKYAAVFNAIQRSFVKNDYGRIAHYVFRIGRHRKAYAVAEQHRRCGKLCNTSILHIELERKFNFSEPRCNIGRAGNCFMISGCFRRRHAKSVRTRSKEIKRTFADRRRRMRVDFRPNIVHAHIESAARPYGFQIDFVIYSFKARRRGIVCPHGNDFSILTRHEKHTRIRGVVTARYGQINRRASIIDKYGSRLVCSARGIAAHVRLDPKSVSRRFGYKTAIPLLFDRHRIAFQQFGHGVSFSRTATD